MVFAESALAHRFLDGLSGIEIGGSAHNPFNIPGCRNVDFSDDMTTAFKDEERRQAGRALAVDVVAFGDRLPFPDASLQYVLHSHVFEHFWDPIAAVREWLRVLVPGGIVFAIVPHKERTFDAPRPRTTLAELVARHDGRLTLSPDADPTGHHSVWVTADLVELIAHLGLELLAVQDTDDKVGNGFTVVFRKAGTLAGSPRALDLGCGANKLAGCVGIDRRALPGVDCVLDLAHEPLPFPDDSVWNVDSDGLFGFLDDPRAVLSEILRVGRPGAKVRISTAYGAGDAALVPGLRHFYVERTWLDLLAGLGSTDEGQLMLDVADLSVAASTLGALEAQHVPFDFALRHYTNVVSRLRVELSVHKPGGNAASTYTRRLKREEGA